MDASLEKALLFVESNKEEVERLLEHERNYRVIFQGTGFRYERKSDGRYIRLRGLLIVLKEAFFSEVNYWEQKKLFVKKTGRAQKRTTHSRGPDLGRIRGSRIHRELEEFVKLDMKNFTKLNKCVHPWTKSVLKFVKNNNWLPVASEFKLFDPLLRIGTAVDLVCVTEPGKIVLIEIKTGFEEGFFCGSKSMTGPLCSVMNDSPANQACLQVLLSMLIVMKYHKVYNVEAWVVRVRGKPTADPTIRVPLDPIKLPDKFVLKYSRRIYEHLCAQAGVLKPTFGDFCQ